VGRPCRAGKGGAVDGSQYSVIVPVFDGSGGSLSFIRLYNGSTTASTFNILVVNTNNGITMGAASIEVPANASPQYALTQPSGESIFSLAGVAPSSNANYALYIQNGNALAGYQHVTFNPTSTLFENNSVCTTPLSAQMSANSRYVLTNLHSSAFAAYPSIVSIHNYSGTGINLTLSAFDAATGASLGQFNQSVGPNATLVLPETQMESQLVIPSLPQHINLEITNAAGGAAPIRLAHAIRNAQLGGDINMAEACAVNAVPPTVVQVPVAPTVPTAYCGTFKFPTGSVPFPYYLITYNVTISVAPNGRIRGAFYGEYGTTVDGGTVTGTVSGTTWVGTSSGGFAGSGTIQNGTITGVLSAGTVDAPISGSTTACN